MYVYVTLQNIFDIMCINVPPFHSRNICFKYISIYIILHQVALMALFESGTSVTKPAIPPQTPARKLASLVDGYSTIFMLDAMLFLRGC